MQRVASVKRLPYLPVHIVILVEWHISVLSCDRVVNVGDILVDINNTLDIWVGFDYVIIIRHAVNPNTTSRVSSNRVASYDGLRQEWVSANRCVMLFDDMDRFAHSSVTIHARAWVKLYVLLCSNSKLRLKDEIAKGNMTLCVSVRRDPNSSTTGQGFRIHGLPSQHAYAPDLEVLDYWRMC